MMLQLSVEGRFFQTSFGRSRLSYMDGGETERRAARRGALIVEKQQSEASSNKKKPKQ